MLRWTLMQREHWWNQYGMLLNVFYYTLRNPHYKDPEEAIHKLKGTCWRMQHFWCPMFICYCNIYPYDGDLDELFSCPRGSMHCSLHVQWSLHMYCIIVEVNMFFCSYGIIPIPFIFSKWTHDFCDISPWQLICFKFINMEWWFSME